MKPTTEEDFKKLLDKLCDEIQDFEKEYNVTIGSEFLLLSNGQGSDYKETFIFNGASFVKANKDMESPEAW